MKKISFFATTIIFKGTDVSETGVIAYAIRD